MRVLYISHDANLSGAPKSLLEFVTRIREKGVRPIVLVPGNGALKRALHKEEIDTRIIRYKPCVYLGTCRREDSMEYCLINRAAVGKIIRLIREEEIDIVHSNSLAVRVGAWAAYLARVPHVWHFREYLEEDYGYQRLFPAWEKFLARRSVCRIAISRGIQEKYQEKYGVNALLLYNGVDSRRYYRPVQREQTGQKSQRLLLAGTICEGKGQWDAVRAVELLRQRGLLVSLDLVGDGMPACVSRLKRYVREKGLEPLISFIPYTAELGRFRRESMAVLVCSRLEAFGRVTAEAMLAGKIVIGSDSGGTRELIGEHEERGYLYSWGRPGELADRIQYVMKHREETEEKERRAQEFIRKLTDVEAYAGKMAGLYRRILLNRGISKRRGENGK